MNSTETKLIQPEGTFWHFLGGREPDARSWAAISVMRRFMAEEATDAERDAASDAVRDAARSAAWSAASDAFNERLTEMLLTARGNGQGATAAGDAK